MKMKIQCTVCEKAEAKVLCCADEAALCWSCDDKIHAANKLANKHQRVPLSASNSPMPKCDICQETVGYFFCLEDRALLCRKCDTAIHTVNCYVSAHRRFLLTGVKVGLEPLKNSDKPQNIQKPPVQESPKSKSKRSAPVMPPSDHAECNNAVLPAVPITSGVGGFVPKQSPPFAGGSSTESIPQWQLDEFLGMNDFNPNYGYMEYGSSKADQGKLGESDNSSILREGDGEVGGDDQYLPETSCWAVPQIPSPPTASGLNWPKSIQNPFDSLSFEQAEICYSPLENFVQHQPSNDSGFKRRNTF